MTEDEEDRLERELIRAFKLRLNMTPEMRRALERFGDEMDRVKAAGGKLFDVLVPAVLGDQCGGGKRFGDCLPAEVAALGHLHLAAGRDELVLAEAGKTMSMRRSILHRLDGGKVRGRLTGGDDTTT